MEFYIQIAEFRVFTCKRYVAQLNRRAAVADACAGPFELGARAEVSADRFELREKRGKSARLQTLRREA